MNLAIRSKPAAWSLSNAALLAGSGKPFVATSGAGHLGDSGNSGLKEDAPAHGPRAEASESTVLKVSTTI